ncbi:hypothetical protein [Corynebacterium callunae]|uniref:Scaffolding protein n=1 Tax=Corynebacterium callunae DSM 20147 TaxID=1121353 RepID=M1UFE0_9CORY|nr:hypothetical protein [Corynebacterium callunae]AGG66885.1 hypothetical protein H924_07215 [Corynebacterium callunae DSM 20147]
MFTHTRPWLRFIEGAVDGGLVGDGEIASPQEDPTLDAPKGDVDGGKGDRGNGDDASGDDAWKAHSRKWEDRARKNLKDLEAAQAELASRPKVDEFEAARMGLQKMQKENAVFRGLLALDADSKEIGVLLDSKSFDAAVAELDPSDEGFGEALRKISVGVLQNFRPKVEGFSDKKPASRGDELYALLHGEKKNGEK